MTLALAALMTIAIALAATIAAIAEAERLRIWIRRAGQ